MSLCCWKVLISINCCTKIWLHQISGCGWRRDSKLKFPEFKYIKWRILVHVFVLLAGTQ
jgi:hypothetical protein